MFKISQTPLEEIDLKGPLANPRAGGFVAFEGWVRDLNEGRGVTSLEYEAYTLLAEKEGNRILKEACEKFDIIDVHCWHRTGHLQLGHMAVWVGATAEHRGDAFEACRYVIDEVKERVPIWKKEHYEEGDSGWVRCESVIAEPGQPPPQSP